LTHSAWTRGAAALIAVSLSLVAAAATAQEAPRPGAVAKAPAIKARKINAQAVVPKISTLKVDPPQDAGPARDFRWEGEELFYSVEISGADAARASVRIGKRKTANGVTFVPIAADAISHGFFAKTYPVNNRADTFVDVKTFQPVKADKIIRENGSERTYKVRYMPGAFTARVERHAKEKDVGANQRTYDRAVPGAIHDGISWLFDLRSQPLKPGDTYTYYIYDGWKLSRLKVKVVGKEKAWTPLKEYPAIKLDVEREILNSAWTGTKKKRGEPTLSGREKPYYFASIYLSDDDARVPVKIFVTSSKADSELKLVEYKAPGAAPAPKKGK
jgi:hypothetical protein